MAEQTITPEVGMGATYAIGSDRYAATIVQVLLFKSGARKGQVRGVVVQDDHVRLASGSEQDGSATYTYTPNSQAVMDTFLWSDDAGCFVLNGHCRLRLGHRSFYRDPSF